MKLNEIQLTPLLDTLRLEKITDEIYFSNKYKSYISNSRLGLLNPKQDGTPQKFFEGSYNNNFSTSLSCGSAVHELTLQPELFELAPDLEKPTAKLGAMADELFPIFASKGVSKEDIINASNKVDYYKGKMTEDRINEVITKCTPYWNARLKMDLSLGKEPIYLDQKTRETVISCVNALKENESVQKLLHPEGLFEEPIVGNELAILLDVEAKCPNGKTVILHLKSKLDNFSIDTETNTVTVNDIKTLGRILSEFSINVDKYRYNRELGMYCYLLKLCAEKFYNLDSPKIAANYLVVSTIPNYYTKVVEVNYNDLKKGFHEFKTLLKYAAYLMCYQDYTLDEQPSKFKFR